MFNSIPKRVGSGRMTPVFPGKYFKSDVQIHGLPHADILGVKLLFLQEKYSRFFLLISTVGKRHDRKNI
jgi:hypothetical protein